MPTVGLFRDELFGKLGRTFTQDEFELLCFEFGVELDEVTSEAQMAADMAQGDEAKATGLSEEVIYKIDVPANRYDLLCMEGIARAIRIFLGVQAAPIYTMVEPAAGRLTMTVEAETAAIRPFVVCAIMRGIDFSRPEIYRSFIDLQEKLHQNICRKRSLVAIGTHDLAACKPPFRYRACAPADIDFVPLTESDDPAVAKSWRADQLLEHYRTDARVKHLKPYVPLIEGAPRYPVIYDAAGTVLSLPPIINGKRTRIQPTTRDVFIECTATDLTKANVVLDTMVTMFSEHCARAFSVEPVDIIYEEKGAVLKTDTTPLLSTRTVEAAMKDIQTLVGVPLAPEDVCQLLTKMQLGPADAVPERDSVRATVPPTRSDILHAVDVIEDVAIAFGYNNLPTRLPRTQTVGRPQPLNQLCDLLREEVARAGYVELLTHGLCKAEENFGTLRRPAGPAVQLLNPASEEFEVVRTTLLVGALKTLQHNKRMAIGDGIKLFEISDVVLVDGTTDVGSRNVRRLVATFTGASAGFEIIHGLLDRVMLCAMVAPTPEYAGDSLREEDRRGGIDLGAEAPLYSIEPCDDQPTYFPGRAARVVLQRHGQERVVLGSMGILHPEVLKAYQITYPCSALEIDLEPLMAPGTQQ